MFQEERLFSHIIPEPEYLGKMIGISYRYLSEYLMGVVKEKGFHNFSMQYVAVIMNADEEGVSVNSLAEKIQISKQAVSKMAKELQKYGYVSLNKNPNDSRSILITPTNQGNDLVKLIKRHNKKFVEEITKTWGDAKTKTFLNDLYFVMQVLIAKSKAQNSK